MTKKYTVGYGKPPENTKFKKGQSGNPKGRAPASKSLKSALRAELSQRISITEVGKTRKVSKMEALAKRLTAQALKGDARALVELLRQINIHLHEADVIRDDSLPAKSEDLAILAAFAKRANGLLEEGDDAE